MAALAFLPISNWLPGGHAAPWYGAVGAEWLSGSAIVLGLAVVLAIASRRVPVLWRSGASDAGVMWAHARPTAFGTLVSLCALLVYALVAARLFSRVPITIDELVQLMQARMFAQGRTWEPVGADPTFHSLLNVVDLDGRYYGQFPPGWPALLAVGVIGGAPWMVGPLCGAIAVAAFWSYVRVVEPARGVAVGAVLLFAFAPFAAFMAGSHMNHMPTLMCIVVAMACLARVIASPSPRPGLALLSGVAFGAAATIRPVDAVAFALPAGVWYLAMALRDRSRWRDLVASGLGVAVPATAMLLVNAHTTGAPFVFGYQVLWGKSHDLGFHRAPWGAAHTPQRGFELVNLYLLRLQTYLFEASLPSLAPFLGALCLTPNIDRLDRYLLVSGGLLLALYFAYWHDGFVFGPRFVFALLPMLALWTARLPRLVSARFGGQGGVAHRVVTYAYVTASVLALTVSIPARAREYAHAFVPMRLDHVGTTQRAGVEHALVFVRESWGTQLMVRLWALGVPRSEAELLYSKADACVLEMRITELEGAGVRDTAALQALLPALADSARAVKSPFSPDVTERYVSGVPYSPLCVRRIEEDRAGFTLLAPILATDWGTNLYARDMHARNRVLALRHPDRPLFLLRPRTNEIGAPLDLVPLSRDSVLSRWETDASAPR